MAKRITATYAALPTTLLKVGSEINKAQLKITKGNTPEIHNANLYFFSLLSIFYHIIKTFQKYFFDSGHGL